MANVAQIGVGIRNDAGPGSRAFQADAARVSRSARGAAADVKNLQTKMTTLGRSSAGAGSQIMKAFGVLGGIAVVASATKAISEFEETMALAGKVSRASTEQFAKMTEVAKTLGATTRFTASEAADGLLFLGRAGFAAEEAMAALPSTLNLAQAGVMGLGDAADLASNVVKQFGLAAADTVRVVDALLIVSNRSNTSVSQLGEAMKYAGPVAGSLGLSVEQTAAAMGALGDAGIQASLAGTNLRGVFSALLGPTGKAKKSFADMGIQLEDMDVQTNGIAGVFEEFAAAGLSAADAVAIFGRRNAAAALVLADSVGKMQELELATKLNRGEAEEMARVMDDTLSGSLKNLKSAFEGLMLAGGDAGFAGALRTIVDTTTGVLRVFAGMQDSIEKNRTLILGLATVVEILVVRFVALKALSLLKFFTGLVVSVKASVIAARAAGAGFAAMGSAAAVALGPIGLIATVIGVGVSIYNNASRASEEYARKLERLGEAQEEFNSIQESLARATSFEQRVAVQTDVIENLHKQVIEAHGALKNVDKEEFQFGRFFEGAVGQGFNLSPDIFDQLGQAYDRATVKTDEFKDRQGELTSIINQTGVAVVAAANDIRERFAELSSLEAPELDYTDQTLSIEKRTKALAQAIRVESQQINGLADISSTMEKLTALTDESSDVYIKNSQVIDSTLSSLKALLGDVSVESLKERSAALAEMRKQLIELQGTPESDSIKEALINDALEERLRLLNQSADERKLESEVTRVLKTANQELKDLTEEQVKAMRDRLVVALELQKTSQAEKALVETSAKQVSTLKEQAAVTELLAEGKHREAAILREVQRLQQTSGQLGVAATQAMIEEVQKYAGELFDAQALLEAFNKSLSKTGETKVDPLSAVLAESKEKLAAVNAEISTFQTKIDGIRGGQSSEQIEATVRAMERQAESQLRLEQMKQSLQTTQGGEPLDDSQISALERQNNLYDIQVSILDRLFGQHDKLNQQRERGVTATEALSEMLAKINNENANLEATIRGTTDAQRIQNEQDEIGKLVKQAMVGATQEQITALTALQGQLQQAAANRENLTQKAEDHAMMERFAEAAANGFAGAITDVISGTKDAGEAIQQFVVQLGQMIVQQMLAAAISKVLKASMPSLFADGAAFYGGKVTPFAKGGVVGTPSIFPMADGNVGLMGEAGPEAIMPLKRTKSGRLGVEMAEGGQLSGGSRVVNINMTVNTPDANSFKRSRKQIADQMRAMGAM